MQAPQKAKIELSYDPAILLLRIYQKKCKSGYNKGTCTFMFVVETMFIHNNQAMKTATIPHY
jgi:hypothetical protein